MICEMKKDGFIFHNFAKLMLETEAIGSEKCVCAHMCVCVCAERERENQGQVYHYLHCNRTIIHSGTARTEPIKLDLV